MRKRIIQLMSIGLVLGLGTPALAQHSGVANTAEDFKSAESNDGVFGSNLSIWDIMSRMNSNGAGVTDDGFYRSQGRRINREADSLRSRQRAILQQQQAAETEAQTLETIELTAE